MIALKIIDNKDFMSNLLKGNTFDTFWLSEAVITTFNTFTIDGNMHLEFFDPVLAKSLESSGRTNSYWAEIKPFCFSIIKGKHTPLNFKIIFQLSREHMEQALENSDTGLLPENVAGMFLNLQFNGTEITCTTGTSLRLFTLDKSLDVLWDNMVLAFFKQHGIAFEQL
ncbi:MAG: DUF5721 family protein [Blautia sp.]